MTRAQLPLSEGFIYARGTVVGCSEQFWEIDPSTVRVCDQGADTLKWPTIAIAPAAKRTKSKIFGPKVDLRGLNLAAKRLKVVRELLKLVRNNVGFAVLIGGPEDRFESARLVYRERPYESHVVYRASSRRCAEASLVNGAERVLGPREAMAIERKLFAAGGGARKFMTSFRRVQELLHAYNKSVQAKLEMRKYSEGDKPSFRSNAFRWLTEESKGVWIVRFVESGIGDHYFVVGTRVAQILECAAQHPISQTEEALRLCGADDARDLRLAKVRQLVPQTERNKKRNAKRARLE